MRRRKMDIIFAITFAISLFFGAYVFQQTSNHLYRQQQIRIQQDDMRALERQGYSVDIHKNQIKAMKAEDTRENKKAQVIYIKVGLAFLLWSSGAFAFIKYLKWRT